MKKIFFILEVTCVFFLLFPVAAIANIQGIETGGMRIYSILVTVGKWVIIVKGCVDCIQSILAGDFQMAKRQFMGYLMCFAIILMLPWGLNEIEVIFQW